MEVKVGNVIIGGDNPIVVQTMCNTHTSDVEASVAQCIRLAKAGAQMIRLTVPSLAQIEDPPSEICRSVCPISRNLQISLLFMSCFSYLFMDSPPITKYQGTFILCFFPKYVKEP